VEGRIYPSLKASVAAAGGVVAAVVVGGDVVVVVAAVVSGGDVVVVPLESSSSSPQATATSETETRIAMKRDKNLGNITKCPFSFYWVDRTIIT